MNQWNNIIAILSVTLTLFILFHKKFRLSSTWHATVTPLASIIGSGFLVSAPLLLLTTGHWALVIMIIIVIIAYCLGSSIRFNIRYVEPQLQKKSTFVWVHRTETLSRPILGIAYIISVSFYLKLLSAFALRGIGLENIYYENILTSLLLLFIGITGRFQGLSMLELLETYSVNTKLAIIFALIITHFTFNLELLSKGQWVVLANAHESWWLGFRKVLGMLIIVQGFETSRYLGHAYSSEKRIQTMRYAQYISGIIYVLFVGLTMVVFKNIRTISETTVIDLCHIVAPILPIFLVIAAIMSQFSAAIADTVGSGGLLCEASQQKISVNNSYLLITSTAMVLTWLTNIYQIISIASKAFAIYYALQVLLTLLTLQKNDKIIHRLIKSILYSLLLLLLLLVISLGIPSE